MYDLSVSRNLTRPPDRLQTADLTLIRGQYIGNLTK